MFKYLWICLQDLWDDSDDSYLNRKVTCLFCCRQKILSGWSQLPQLLNCASDKLTWMAYYWSFCPSCCPQMVLSSSMKRVELVSQDKFNTQRDALEPQRARSFTEAEFPPPSPPVTTVPHATLSPSAEVFRPRANTAPSEPVSRSLPTTVPESPTQENRHGPRTPKRKDVKVAPRFFPAFSKENLSDQVSGIKSWFWFSVITVDVCVI